MKINNVLNFAMLLSNVCNFNTIICYIRTSASFISKYLNILHYAILFLISYKKKILNKRIHIHNISF